MIVVALAYYCVAMVALRLQWLLVMDGAGESGNGATSDIGRCQ